MPEPRPLTPAPGAPTLVIGIGNPARGDDAIGPLLAERLEALAPAGVEILTDYQLQIEHVLDLRGRQAVIFADASVSGAEPCALYPVAPAADASYSTHALSPAALLHHGRRLDGATPDAYVLAIRGYEFGLGAALSAGGRQNLEAAWQCLTAFLEKRRTGIG